MTSDAVLKILRRRAFQAGVVEFSPRLAGLSVLTSWMPVDIVTVQKLAGHSSPVTTAKYDRR